MTLEWNARAARALLGRAGATPEIFLVLGRP